jgi:hypothetical protein
MTSSIIAKLVTDICHWTIIHFNNGSLVVRLDRKFGFYKMQQHNSIVMLVLGVKTAITQIYLQENVYHVSLMNFQNHVTGVLNIPLNITTLTMF